MMAVDPMTRREVLAAVGSALSGCPLPTALVDTDGRPVDSTQRSRCILTKTDSQTFNSGVYTAVTFNGEQADVGGLHDNATNNTRITIPAGGDKGFWLFVFSGVFTLGSNPTTGIRAAELRKNGTYVTGALDARTAYNDERDQIKFMILVSGQAAGDYFEVFAMQSSGANNWGLDNARFEAFHVF